MLSGQRWYPGLAARLVAVNGGTGALLTQAAQVLALVGVTVADAKITEIDLVVNPHKLRRAQAITAPT